MKEIDKYISKRKPIYFGDNIRVDFKNMLNYQGIYSSGIEWHLKDKVERYSGLLEDLTEPIIESLLGKSLVDLMDIYILEDGDFNSLVSECDFSGYDYDKNYNWKKIDAFQQGYSMFLRSGRDLKDTFISLFHEFGAVLKPYQILLNDSGEVNHVGVYSSSNFLTELGHYFMQHSAITKLAVEFQGFGMENQIYFERDISTSPIHFHAAIEAIDLLLEKLHPIDFYGEVYKGNVFVRKNAVPFEIKRKDGIFQDYWVGPKHKLYLEEIKKSNGVVKFYPIKDIVVPLKQKEGFFSIRF